MAFLKDILDALKQPDEDDFDMDDYDDYREAELEKERKRAEKAQKREASRAKRKTEADEEEEAKPARRASFASRSAAQTEKSETTAPQPRTSFRFAQQSQAATAAPAPQPAQQSRVLSRPAPVRSVSRTGMEVSIMKPTCFEDSQDICDALVSGKPIIVNLENFDMDLAQRVMDFVCGCLYSINGKLHQISGYIFIVSPDDVDISGDYLALMRQDGFGVPTFNRKL